MKAIIKQTRQTKILQGMFRTRMYWFVLVGDNGEVIATGETVSQKHNVIEVLNKYFPQFVIEDKTPTEGGRVPLMYTPPPPPPTKKRKYY